MGVAQHEKPRDQLLEEVELLRTRVAAAEQAAAELRESERRYRALVERGWDSLTLLDADGHIRYVRPALEGTLNYPLEEIVRYNAFDLVHPDDLPAARAAFARLRQDPDGRIAMQ